MGFRGFRKTNHPAVAGFLMPFAAAGFACVTVLSGQRNFASPGFRFSFLFLIPFILLIGILLSMKSIPLIKERGDKDYAYSGLVLNAFFILMYIASLVYYLAVASKN
ncbi:MAG: hypothetical protein MUO52_15130 [Desulfobacterales bacterium]|nr:hypothetical protein [Desulfobacterales bacterium]